MVRFLALKLYSAQKDELISRNCYTPAEQETLIQKLEMVLGEVKRKTWQAWINFGAVVCGSVAGIFVQYSSYKNGKLQQAYKDWLETYGDRFNNIEVDGLERIFADIEEDITRRVDVARRALSDYQLRNNPQ